MQIVTTRCTHKNIREGAKLTGLQHDAFISLVRNLQVSQWSTRAAPVCGGRGSVRVCAFVCVEVDKGESGGAPKLGLQVEPK